MNVTSWRGRDLISASVSAVGFLTKPPISSFHVLGSMTGRLKCAIEKNLSLGVIQEFEVLPDELVLDNLRNWVRRQLIEPFDDFLTGAAWKSIGVSGGEEGRKTRKGRTALCDEFSTLNFCMMASPDCDRLAGCENGMTGLLDFRTGQYLPYTGTRWISVLLDVKVKGFGESRNEARPRPPALSPATSSSGRRQRCPERPTCGAKRPSEADGSIFHARR